MKTPLVRITHKEKPFTDKERKCANLLEVIISGKLEKMIEYSLTYGGYIINEEGEVMPLGLTK